jgi:2-haloacid dehalogenase
MRPEAVIFDIGNVLTHWQPEAFYDREIGEDRRRQLFAAVDLHGMNLSIDAGALFQPTVYDWADRHPDWADEIRMWHDRWGELASPRINGSIALLRGLRFKGVPVFCLTNFGADTYEAARGHLEFLNEFDREYVSGRMGVVKPDPNIYAMVEDDCGIASERLLFTDDREENIATAAARGWQVHLFTGWEGWAARLVGAGLLTTQEAGL